MNRKFIEIQLSEIELRMIIKSLEYSHNSFEVSDSYEIQLAKELSEELPSIKLEG